MNSVIRISLLSFVFFSFPLVCSSYDLLEMPFNIQHSSKRESDYLLAEHNIQYRARTEKLSLSDIAYAINDAYDENSLLFDCSCCTPLHPKEYFADIFTILECQNRFQELTQEDLKALEKQNRLFKQCVDFYVKKSLKKFDKTTYSTDPTIQKMEAHILQQNLPEYFRTYAIQKAHNSIPFHYKVTLAHDYPITAWDFCEKKHFFACATEDCLIYLWNLETGQSRFLPKTISPVYRIALSLNAQHTAFCVRDKKNKACVLQIWKNPTRRNLAKLIAQYNDAPYYIESIIYTLDNNIIIKGRDTKTVPFSDHHFNVLQLINTNSVTLAEKRSSRASIQKSSRSSYSSHQSDSDDKNPIVIEKKGCHIVFEERKNEAGYKRHCAVIGQKSMPVFFLKKSVCNAQTVDELREIRQSPEYGSLWQTQRQFIDNIIARHQLPFKTKVIAFLSSLPGYDFFGIPKPEDWVW